MAFKWTNLENGSSRIVVEPINEIGNEVERLGNFEDEIKNSVSSHTEEIKELETLIKVVGDLASENMTRIDAHDDEIEAVGAKAEATAKELYQAFTNIDIPIVETGSGYVTANGTISVGSTFRYAKTAILDCAEGDVFEYDGKSYAQAVSYIFYNGDTIVSSAQTGWCAISTHLTVTIPSGVNKVLFASMQQDSKDAVLVVVKRGSIADRVNTVEAEVTELEAKVDGAVSNVLAGKKYVACGDSFTAGTSVLEKFTDGAYEGEYKTYPFLIGRRNGMTVVNEAKSGSTMTYINGSRNEFSTVNGRYTQIPEDADYITLKFGINDDAWHQKAPVGTIDDTVNTTFYGAWNIVMEYLITNHPFAKIGIIITNGLQSATNEPYAEATRQIAKKWGIPYLDEDNGEQVPLLHLTNRADVCSAAKNLRNSAFRASEDDMHPNTKAHEYESTFVEAWLRTL